MKTFQTLTRCGSKVFPAARFGRVVVSFNDTTCRPRRQIVNAYTTQQDCDESLSLLDLAAMTGGNAVRLNGASLNYPCCENLCETGKLMEIIMRLILSIYAAIFKTE